MGLLNGDKVWCPFCRRTVAPRFRYSLAERQAGASLETVPQAHRCHAPRVNRTWSVAARLASIPAE